MNSRKKTGNMGESVAARFLTSRGYAIVARNVLRPWGEIDIIAVRGGVVHFVEVKAISCENVDEFSRENGPLQPEQNITAHKLKKLARTAELYMHEQKDMREYQIDGIAVFLDMQKRRARCRLYEQIL